jgi:uncharacterized protein (DUF952 family)
MIYHITRREDWDTTQNNGEYRADSLATQGFIHFSLKYQIVRVADTIYRGQPDLVLLCVDENQLDADMRFEPPDPTIPAHHYTGELFPHLYGALNLDSVTAVIEFSPDETGRFDLPQGL